MATTETIGATGRNYSTLQAWEDAVPATPTDGYIGECYNDAAFTAGVTIDGHTTSATNFIRLTAASGQSFQDHADVRTNALFYNQSNGVAVAASTFSAGVVHVSDDWVEVLRLQIKRTGSSYDKAAVEFSASLGNSFVKDCIVEKSYSANETIVRFRESSAYNVIAIETGGGTSIGFSQLNTGTTPVALNCTSVRSSALGAGGTGFGASATYSPSIVKNCASFGWTTDFSASGWDASSDYNASDGTGGPGANSVDSLTYADQFESTTADFRIKSGSGLIDTGNTDATLAPNDISGTARGLTTDGDIGAWEFVAAGGAAFSLDAQPGSFSLTGAVAGALAGRAVDAQPGAFTLTGFAVTLVRGFQINAEPGVYILIGVDANMLAARMLNAEPGAFVVTGVEAALLADRVISADPGAFTFTGFVADLVYVPTVGAFEINAEPGAFVVTGFDAAVVGGRVLDAQPGTFVLTGADAGLLVARMLDASPGVFLVTGSDAGLLADRVLAADPGALVITGTAAGLFADRVLSAAPGTFAVTGFEAELLASALQAFEINAEPGTFIITGAAARALLDLDQFPEGGGDGERVHTRGIIDFNWGPRS